MTDALDPLISALRSELQQYGELLALLDHQQELVISRVPNELLESVASIRTQAAALQKARLSRQSLQDTFASTAGLSDSQFATLLPILPPSYQPLVQALVEENNELLARVQARARQNHLLLSRSLDWMQKLISSLAHAPDLVRYDPQGQTPSPILSSLYEAIG